MTFQVKNLDHVVATVTDVEAAAALYQKNFGIAASERQELPQFGLRNAILPIGQAFIELAEPLGDSGPIAQALTDRGEGLYLIALEVDDLDAAVGDLRAKGYRASDPAPGSRPTYRLAFVSPRSAHGVLLQLIEHRPADGSAE